MRRAHVRRYTLASLAIVTRKFASKHSAMRPTEAHRKIIQTLNLSCNYVPHFARGNDRVELQPVYFEAQRSAAVILINTSRYLIRGMCELYTSVSSAAYASFFLLF